MGWRTVSQGLSRGKPQGKDLLQPHFRKSWATHGPILSLS